MKGVFDTKPDSGYSDITSARYHFPSRYLALVTAMIGDYVVFRRPRADGGNMGYSGVARVILVQTDPNVAGHYFALLDDYVPFETAVPWRVDGRYFEAALREVQPISQVGVFLRGRSVRSLNEDDFGSILQAALAADGDAHPARAVPVNPERQIREIVLRRKIRDVKFRETVCGAYGYRCALTGTCFVDADKRYEVQAAHIVPVSLGGLDIVQNGLSLSSTIHWLFDHHLVSVDEHFRVLVSPSAVGQDFGIPEDFAGRKLLLPRDTSLWPSQQFLGEHRRLFGI